MIEFAIIFLSFIIISERASVKYYQFINLQELKPAWLEREISWQILPLISFAYVKHTRQPWNSLNTYTDGQFHNYWIFVVIWKVSTRSSKFSMESVCRNNAHNKILKSHLTICWKGLHQINPDLLQTHRPQDGRKSPLDSRSHYMKWKQNEKEKAHRSDVV